MEKEILSILTDQQRIARTLRERGMTYRQIGETMEITENAARTYCRLAAQRLREYEAYHRPCWRNDEPVEFSVTRGELKLMRSGLWELASVQERRVHRNFRTDWLSRLPYEHQLITELAERMKEWL